MGIIIIFYLIGCFIVFMLIRNEVNNTRQLLISVVFSWLTIVLFIIYFIFDSLFEYFDGMCW